MKITESQLHNIIKESVSRILKEDVTEHWENMIKKFFYGLNKGRAEIHDGTVIVDCGNKDYPRYVYLDIDNGTLKDDNCYVQNSRRLTTREVKKLLTILQNKYDVDCSEQMYDYGFNESVKHKPKHLSEMDLHNIVKESVKSVLSELDARTYASAANKANQRFDYERKNKFQDAAVDAWNKKYSEDEWNPANGILHNRDMMHNYDVVDHYQKHPDPKDMWNTNTKTVKYDPTDDTEQTQEVDFVDGETTNFKRGEKQPRTQNLNHGRSVARQMATGTGNYVKGKGWQ